MESISKEKAVFAFMHNATRELVENFSQALLDSTGIKSRIDRFPNHYILFVSENDYYKALSEGSLLAELNHIVLFWVDRNDRIQKKDYIPAMYCVLPQVRKGNQTWNYYSTDSSHKCPEDIQKYMLQLREYICDKEIQAIYNHDDNAFTIYVRAPFSSHELISKQCRGFNYINDSTPFLETYYLSWDNTLNINKKEIIAERRKKIKSYFDESLFVDGICKPECYSICSHVDEERNAIQHPDFSLSSRAYWYDEFYSKVIDNRCQDTKLVVKGDFEAFEQKRYRHKRYRPNDTKMEQKSLTTDKGRFTCQIELSEEGVVLETVSEVDRTIEGTNYNGINIRDGLFADFPNETGKGRVKVREYYTPIANGTRLLHYSDKNDFFEIYELPHNWFIENGIEGLGDPKVFDDLEYDEEDKDLEVVCVILNARERTSGKVRKLIPPTD